MITHGQPCQPCVLRFEAMTTAKTLSLASLRDELFAHPHDFDFSQVIDVLELLESRRLSESSSPEPQLTSVTGLGSGTNPRAEVVRLTANFSMGFNGCAINYLQQSGEAGAVKKNRPELSVNFFGLGGSDGPLPEPYIDMVLSRLLSQDNASADFLDIFQHRLLSFVYRSAQAFRLAAPFKAASKSPLMPALDALLGRQSSNRHPLLEPILLTHSGLIAQQRHSMHGFLTLLRSHFKMAVQGCEFAGRWVALPDELQTILGRQGQNDLLGAGAVLGHRAWDQNGAIAILIGPLPLQQYLDLLPEAAGHQTLQAICAFYLGPHIHCIARIELDLAPDAADHFQLGEPDFKLAYTTWLAPYSPPFVAYERSVTLIFNDGDNTNSSQKEQSQ